MPELDPSARIRISIRATWTLATVLVAIVVTGGIRIGGIDLQSLGVWALFALFAFLFGGDSDGLLRQAPKFALRVAERPWPIIVFLLTAIALAHTLRYVTFGVYFEDAGYVYQGLFHAFSPSFLHCDVCVADSYLGEHQSYSLALLRAWTLLFPTPYLLPTLAAILAGTIFWNLDRTLKTFSSRWLLAYLALAILSIRGFRNGILFDFREDLLGAAFFSFALASLEKKKVFGLFVGGTLAALSKETGALIFPIFATILFFDPTGRKYPVSTRISVLALSIGIAVFCFAYGIPHWSSEGKQSSMLVSRYGFLGASTGEIIRNLLLRPDLLFPNVDATTLIRDHGRYLLFTVAPFAPFFLRSWNALYLPAFAVIAINLVSPAATQRSMVFHYDLYALPFFAFALARSIVDLRKQNRFTARFAGVTFLLFLAVSGSWPMSRVQEGLRNHARFELTRFVREAAKSIPLEETVLADALIYPHLVDRSDLRLFPHGGRGGKTHTAVSHALLHRDAFEKSAPEWKREWTSFDCDRSNLICHYRRTIP